MRKLWSLAAVVVLILSACGGSEDQPEAAPQIVVAEPASEGTQDTPEENAGAGVASDADGATDEELALEFVDCMRDEGVDIPDATVNPDGTVTLGGGPGGGGGGGQGGGLPEGFQDAFDACGDIIDGASFGPGNVDLTEFEDQLLAFAGCLRGQGLDVDDPDLDNFQPGQGGRGGPFGDGFDPQDPANADAIQACQGEISFGPGGAAEGGE